MLRIDEYIDELIDILKGAFGERLVYIGLQGSYLRGKRLKAVNFKVADNL